MPLGARHQRLVALVQDNLRLLNQSLSTRRLADDEPYVTLQVGGVMGAAAPATPKRFGALRAPLAPVPRRQRGMRTADEPSATSPAAPAAGRPARPPTTQVGKQVFERAPRDMRTELWKSSLQRRGMGVAAAKSYPDLLEHGQARTARPCMRKFGAQAACARAALRSNVAAAHAARAGATRRSARGAEAAARTPLGRRAHPVPPGAG